MKFSFALLISLISLSLFSQPPVDNIPVSPTDISPLLIGESVPDMTLKTANGESVAVLEKIAFRNSVIIFYRGGWCPYCNNHLAELQSIEEEILGLGFQILAISPDGPDELQSSLEKQGLSYELLSDADMEFSHAFGIAFQAQPRSKDRLYRVSDGMNTGLLPVPSVFVVDQQGAILFEYINPDYKQRMPADLLLAVLRTLH